MAVCSNTKIGVHDLGSRSECLLCVGAWAARRTVQQGEDRRNISPPRQDPKFKPKSGGKHNSNKR
jgi:hypothetical protein